MRNLTGCELHKIWHKKAFLLLLGILLFLNLFFFWYESREQTSGFSASAYRLLAADLKGKTEEEKADFLFESWERSSAYYLIEQIAAISQQAGPYTQTQIDMLKEEHPGLYEKYADDYRKGYSCRYTPNLREEAAFLTEIWQEAGMAADYSGYLERIREKAGVLSSIGLFSAENGNSSYSARNIEKTVRDYAGMENRVITIDVNKGFMHATGFFLSDLVLLALLFAISCVLVYEEKQKNLFSLIRQTGRGRSPLMLAKILALFLSGGLIVLLLYGSVLAASAAIYGLGDLTRSIQSVGPFIGSTLPLSAGSYLFLYLLTKWLSAMFTGLVILLLSLLFSRPAVSLAGSALLYGGGFLLHRLIPFSSVFSPLKYLNFFALLKTNELYRQYRNFNFFGCPVNLLVLLACFLAAVGILLILTLIICFSRKREYRSSAGISLPGMKRSRIPGPGSLFTQECYKLLTARKVLPVLAGFLLIFGLRCMQQTDYLSYEEMLYRQYMIAYQGDYTQDKYSQLIKQQESFQEAADQLKAIDALEQDGIITKAQADQESARFHNILYQQPVFDRACEQISYVNHTRGAKILYDTGYRKLFEEQGGSLDGLLMITACILCLTSLFLPEYKNNAMHLLASTAAGRRKTAEVKLFLALLMAFLITLAGSLPVIVQVCRSYGLHGLFYPLNSLRFYGDAPAGLPIAILFVVTFFCQFISIASASLVVCFLSNRIRDGILAPLISILLLAVPVFLTELGLDVFYYLSILPALSPAFYLMEGANFTLFCLFSCLWFGIGLFCAISLYKNFGQPERTKKLNSR
ncbi:hypothetical protein [Anaerolentibacter hominis]|uniref:hypothetical protein n=1 Tax=Anaerolentibacter hominis TaxID=3079009 RepID=UPI0031B89210